MKARLDRISKFIESKYFILISLSLLWLFMGYQSYTRDKLNNQLVAQQQIVSELTERLATNKEQLRVLVIEGQQKHKLIKTLNESVSGLLRRMDEVQQYQLDQVLNQSKETDNKPSFEDLALLQNQIDTLQFQLKSLNQKLYELNKTHITTTLNKQTPANTLVNNANTEVTQPIKKPVLKPLVPPFSVLGIESRGGELFVSVTPSKSANLSQIRLLRIGDSYRNWQLKAIKTNAVVFIVGSRQQVIHVR